MSDHSLPLPGEQSPFDADTERAARAALERMGLVAPGEKLLFTPLTGGVSSDILRVDLPTRTLCIKRALATLKVAAEWHAPVERSADEVAWMRAAARVVPGAAPEVLGVDDETRMFAMPYLDPASHPLWKTLLREGHVEAGSGAAVGDRLGRIHAASAGDAAIADQFATDDKFHAIRLEPYLIATARAHPRCAPALESLAATTARTRRALVHGDVSPKNILIGPHGPMLLDAECAWYGDPAFDVAFCLNHLLLKCLWVPGAAPALMETFGALWRAYSAHVDWEPLEAIEARTARLLPGLMLARVDGKSPVEYLTAASDLERVRAVAIPLLLAPPDRLGAVTGAWTGDRQQAGA